MRRRLPPIPTAIVAHPDRTAAAERLADAVAAEAILWDDGCFGAGANHLRAWRWLAQSSGSWSVVLEDDAVPVAHFRRQLPQALDVAPSGIVSLYLGRGRPPQWQPCIGAVMAPLGRDPHWLSAPSLLHHVGVAIRTELLAGMLATVPRHLVNLPIDEAIGVWARSRRIPISYARPSLVDHADDDPLIGERHDGQPRATGEIFEKRVAWVTGTRPRWGRDVIPMPLPAIL